MHKTQNEHNMENNTETRFEVGQVVVLNSGSPNLTVIQNDNHPFVVVQWWNDKEQKFNQDRLRVNVLSVPKYNPSINGKRT